MILLGSLFPFLGWLRDYNRDTLRADLLAGITVALVLIPQSMAYAQLAGLPSYYGLYAAFLPPMVAALFGSSRLLATGPVAVVSLMTAASLEHLATAGSASFIAYAVVLALLVGVFQFMLGVLRLGLVVNFLSHPVVNGFTSAAAIIIATSQLAKVFGVEVDKAAHHYQTVFMVLEAAWRSTHWPTFAMATLAIAIMLAAKRLHPRLPGVLLAVAVTTLLSWAMGFERSKRIGIDEIASQEVRVMIEVFNGSALEVQKLARNRFAINDKIAGSGTPQSLADKASLLELNHELALVTLQLEEKKEENKLQRAALRDIAMVAVEKKEGRGSFVLPDEVSSSTASEGSKWRLDVGGSALDLDSLPIVGGGAVVGAIPKGLPSMSLPRLDMQIVFQLFPYAVIISLLGFMEAVSIAKAMAARTGQKLDANQELIGQGLANIIGALGSSYPVSGSFSRTAVNMQAGGVTGMSNIFSALLVLLALLFFTPLLYHLPQAVLAAVIMMAVIGLVNIQGFVHAWKTQKYEGVIAVITFVATLYFAPHLDKGILIGVGLSGAVFLHRRMRPKVTTLAMGKDGVLQCATDKRLQLCRHIAVVRFDGTLFFANASYLDEQIFRIRSANPALAHILLVADGINDMDSSGEEALTLLKERLTAAGIGFSLCRVKEDVLALMRRSGLLEKIGRNNIYSAEEAALEAIIARIHAEKTGPACRVCPLLKHVPAEQDRAVPAAAYGAIARQIPDNRRTPSLKGMLDKVVTALAASA